MGWRAPGVLSKDISSSGSGTAEGDAVRMREMARQDQLVWSQGGVVAPSTSVSGEMVILAQSLVTRFKVTSRHVPVTRVAPASTPP